jgi:hypothetical protein
MWLVAALIASGMAYTKDQHVLQRSGLLGYCTTAATPIGSAGDWRACHAGKLSGAPDLTRDSCTRVRLTTRAPARLQYWSCPAQVVASVAAR